MVRNWSTPMNRRNTRSSRSTSTERVTCKRKSKGGARAAEVRAGGAGTEWQRISSGGIPTEGVRSEGTAVSGRAQECLAIQHNGSPTTGRPRPPIHASPQTVWRVLVCVRVQQGHRSAARIRSGAEVGGAALRCRWLRSRTLHLHSHRTPTAPAGLCGCACRRPPRRAAPVKAVAEPLESRCKSVQKAAA